MLMQYMIYAMGAFLIVVALLKMSDWKNFPDAFSQYDIIAKKIRLYAFLYPAIEMGLGISYIAMWQIAIVAAVTFVLMTVGSVGVLKNLLSPNPVKCACLGTRIKVPLTKFTLFEDVLMAIMALMILFSKI